MAAMVRLWVQALDEGWWRWDQNGEPVDTFRQLPRHAIDSELIA
jgi:hypothetical protein